MLTPGRILIESVLILYYHKKKRQRGERMEQSFIEVLVARKRNMGAAVMKIVCGILAVFSLIMVPSSLLFLLAVAVFAAGAWYSYLQEWIEYEYSYVSGELTVDKIMARSRRKSVADYEVGKIEAAAPEGSYHLDGYQGRNYETKDYSSRTAGTFIIYYEGRKKLILDADKGLMEMLRAAAPSKIFLN